MKPLPPFGRRYLEAPPPAGLVVAIGSRSWDFAHTKPHVVVVLPPGADPRNYRWPANEFGALVHETGQADDAQLAGVASELVHSGCPFVVAVRHSSLTSGDCRHFFYGATDDDVIAA